MKFKTDFKLDRLTNQSIPVQEMRRQMKDSKFLNKSFYYLTEVAHYYYLQKYNKSIVEVLKDFHEFPKCPITGEIVSFKLTSSIVFGKYSSKCTSAQITKHISENNQSFKEHVLRMKEQRRGEGNPRFGKTPWNKGLSSETNEKVKAVAEKRKGQNHTDEAKKKQSESAKKRKIHGHTGKSHSKETKELLRQKTIQRIKEKKFPQTNTLPHRKMKEIIQNYFGDENILLTDGFGEEFPYGKFIFDFKLRNYLVEVQGDFFHANPNTRHSGATHTIQRINIGRDTAKKKFVDSSGQFQIVYFWESDILKQPEKIKECLKELNL